MRIKFLNIIIMAMLMVGLTEAKPSVANLLLFASLASVSISFASWLETMPNNNSKLNYQAIFYCGWLAKEIIISSLSVIKIIWSRNSRAINPSFELIETIQKNEAGIAIYANSITLTPGTITLDIRGNLLLIHALKPESIEVLKAQEMDRKVEKIIATTIV